MGLLNALTNAVTNYGDDVVRTAASQYGDDILRAAANQADDVARATTNNMDDALRGLGISQNKNGQFIANGTQSMLKKLLSGSNADQIYPRVDDDYFNMFTNQQFRTPYETAEDLAKVAAFKDIIESGGEMTPIAVRPAGNGQYAIDDGLHRMRAYYETGRQPLFRVFDNKTDSYNFADLWNKSKGNPI